MAILLKPADLRALDVTIRTGFLGAYSSDSYKPRWPMLATRQASGSRKNIYPQIVDAAQIREWVDKERKINGLVIEGAEVTNQKWELTYALRREDLDDDMTGTVAQALSRVRSGAGKYLRHPDKLVFNALKSNGTALDGQPLFGTHSNNPADPASTTFSNDISGSPLTPNNAAAGRGLMLELQLPDGDPANEDPTILVVPPALELTARKIAQADVVVFGSVANETNVYKGMWTVVVVQQLGAAFSGGSDSKWYMADTTDAEDRGLIFQEREAVEIIARFDHADPHVFDLDEYVWGTRARYTAAAGNPKKIFRFGP